MSSVLQLKDITQEDLKDQNLTNLNELLMSMRDELLRLGGYYGTVQIGADIEANGVKLGAGGSTPTNIPAPATVIPPADAGTGAVGTSNDYARGDHKHPASGGSGGAVSSVFSRTGAVVAQTGDYSYSQISGTPTIPSPATAVSPADSGAGVVGVSTNYARQDHVHPAPSGTGALVLLEQHTASNSAELDFTACISSTYDQYLIELVNIVPSVTANPVLQVSTNGGASYDTGTHYQWQILECYTGAPLTSYPSGYINDTKIPLFASPTAGGNFGANVTIKLFGPLSALYTQITYHAVGEDSNHAGMLAFLTGAGAYMYTTPVNAFRIAPTSGVFVSGVVRVYGLANS